MFPGTESFMASPPPAHGGTPGLFPRTPAPIPPWASQILDELKQIKEKVSRIDKIEKAVTSISSKLSDLENSVKSLDARQSDTEKSCTFLSDLNDEMKNDLDSTKEKLKTMNINCQTLDSKFQMLSKEKAIMEEKLISLERKTMEMNLVFYGVPEVSGDEEICEEQVKSQVMKNILEMKEQAVNNLKIDWAYRGGRRDNRKPRPIIVKFTDFKTRENVRSLSFQKGDALKAKGMGISVQWPQTIRDRRRKLFPIMQRLQNEGNNVRMVADRLYVNGQLYRETGTAVYPDRTDDSR